MQKIRIGMIGGGNNNSIGSLHRYALQMDNLFELVGGIFSRDFEKSQAIGQSLNLNSDRIYSDFQKLIEAENKLSSQQKMQLIVIVTPNNEHFNLAKLALENDFHVMLEKPITFELDEAYELKRLADKYDKKCCVNYTYTGYTAIKEAKRLIQEGIIGDIKKIHVKYYQDWLSEYSTARNPEALNWRTDPQKAGKSCTIADIGCHAFNLMEYLSGLEAMSLQACLSTYNPKNKLEDDGMVWVRFSNNVKGMLCVSQTLIGEKENLAIKIHGSLGSIAWKLAQPQILKISLAGKNPETQCVDQYYQTPIHEKCSPFAVNNHSNVAALANHYFNLYHAISQTKNFHAEFPSLEDGIRGMQFIESSVKSQNSEHHWSRLSDKNNQNFFKSEIQVDKAMDLEKCSVSFLQS